MLLALAACHDWKIEQLDVVTSFLNPEVDTDVYMRVPDGFDLVNERRIPSPQNCAHSCNGTQVLKLKIALYGLKQAPCLCYQHINKFLPSLNFVTATLTRMSTSREGARDKVILLLYVAALPMFSSSSARLQH